MVPRVRQRPGRDYSRDKQTCRRRSRGMIKKKRGRPAKPHHQPPVDLSMTLKLHSGTTEFLPWPAIAPSASTSSQKPLT